jgi:integrase
LRKGRGGRPRRKEEHPFESWTELEAVAAAIGPRYGLMILFVAATGPRPAEWIAPEKRDVDREERVVYVRGDSRGTLSACKAACKSTVGCRLRKQKGPVSRAFPGGRTWDRTRDLPRVKRLNPVTACRLLPQKGE